MIPATPASTAFLAKYMKKEKGINPFSKRKKNIDGINKYHLHE
jgi:hypothetical protein